jgi:allantoin racemase
MSNPDQIIQIRIITPHVAPVPGKLDEVADLATGALRLSQANILRGPVSIESSLDEALCAPGVIASAIEAEHAGQHAVIVDCFADPAVDACRELLAIPVVGPGEAAAHVAASLGHRFGVVTVLDSVVPLIEARLRSIGLDRKLAGVRVVDTPVREIHADRPRLLERMVSAAEQCVRQDRADTLVLGCTGFLGLGAQLQQALSDRGLQVPVVSPLRAAVTWAAMLAHLRLSHGRRAYPAPARKPMTGFDLPTPRLWNVEP